MARTDAQITEDIQELSPRGATMFLNGTDTHASYLRRDKSTTDYVDTLINDFNERSDADKAEILSNIDSDLSIIKPGKHPEGEPA